MYICEDIGSNKDDTKNDGLNHSSLPNPRPPPPLPLPLQMRQQNRLKSSFKLADKEPDAHSESSKRTLNPV